MTRSGVRSALRKLAGASAIYGIGSVLTRSLNFALLPVYTRYLSPDQYGLVALTATLITVLGVIYPLGLQGALTRTYYAAGSTEERKQRIGTLWVAMVAGATLMALVLDRLGPELSRVMLPAVPFHPYLRLAVWTAFLAVFGITPLVLLQVQERPSSYVTLTGATSLVTTALVVTFVVLRRDGAYGYLLGGFLGAALATGAYLVLTLRNLRPVLHWAVLGPALAYSLPLVPHTLAGWALEMSDRFILTRFVPLAQVGIYSLGYQLGAAMGLVTAAFNSAWVPFLYGTLEHEGSNADAKLARLVTYYAWGLCFVGLGWSLLVKHAIVLLAGPAFRQAYQITPWVVGGYVCSGLYLIPVNLLFWKSQTRIIPVVTLAAGAANVGLNLWLVPTFGPIAAAWSTLVAYGIMLVLAWAGARRVYRFPYEYRRLGLMAGLAVALFLVGALLPYPSQTADLAARVLLWLAFPLGLIALRALDRTELKALAGFILGIKPRPAA